MEQLAATEVLPLSLKSAVGSYILFLMFTIRAFSPKSAIKESLNNVPILSNRTPITKKFGTQISG
jgi:hypothetical protein